MTFTCVTNLPGGEASSAPRTLAKLDRQRMWSVWRLTSRINPAARPAPSKLGGRSMSRTILCGLAVIMIAACSGCASAQPQTPPSTLKPFATEEALVAHLKLMAADVQRREDEERRRAEATRKRAEQ